MQDLSPSEIEAILKGIGQTATASPSDDDREASQSSPQNISRIQFSELQEEQADKPTYSQEGLKEMLF
jgi:hypothetical protein